MSLEWKIDILAALKDKGYSTYRLRKDKVFGERVVQQLRNGDPVSWEVLSRLCDLLRCDVGDILTAPGSGAADPLQAPAPDQAPDLAQGVPGLSFDGGSGAGVTVLSNREGEKQG